MNGSMTKGLRVACAALAALAVLGAVPALAEPPRGRLLAAQCAQCHGTDGRSAGGIESLAGKNADELLEELLEMKRRPVADELMHLQARGYTDEQLRLIAEYLSSLPGGRDD